MFDYPEVCDALVARWRPMVVALGLNPSAVLDGPATQYAGSEGLAPGTTLTDTDAEFVLEPSDLKFGDREQGSIPNLAWCGSGATGFSARRLRVKTLLLAVQAELAQDRKLGGVVTYARMTGGVWRQVQTGKGALVMCEFTIAPRRL